MTMGQKIYELRKSKNWSQEYVADKIGVSRQAVSRWELDESIPDVEKLSVLSNLFSISIDNLINPQSETTKNNAFVNSDLQKNINKKMRISIICILIGVIVVGGICTLSAIVPSKLKVEQVINREDIILLDPNASDTEFLETDTVTWYMETKGLIPFLNTYYLHWLFIAGCILIIYGVTSVLLVKFKNKRMKKKLVSKE